MNVLFVPFVNGVISHGIPLLALSKKLQSRRFEATFLLPKGAHSLFRMEDANVLDIPHNSLRTEMVAYHRFKPHVVVDDCSVTTAFASELSGLPRVTITRTGSFPGGVPRPIHQVHSANRASGRDPDVTFLGLSQPKHISDLARAKALIIPGVKSVERLPPLVQDDSRYVYAGPLLIRDYILTKEGVLSRIFTEIDRFLAMHKSGPLVLLTFGGVAKAPAVIEPGIRRLLQQGVPVVSTVPLTTSPHTCTSLLYFAKYLPFHRICTRATLIIHHCGSGTYQYPIQYGIPGITIATGCYDRDDVAKRLAELGASIHLEPGDDFQGRLDVALSKYLNPGSSSVKQAKSVLSSLKAESDLTSRSFSFEGVLDAVLATGTKLSLGPL